MKRKARNLIVVGWIALTSCGCPSLWKYNYQEAYDEDEAYLSVPDPQEKAEEASSIDAIE